MRRLVVAVDGPGGTGKSTVSRAVAARLELPHLDTGAYYRAATLGAQRAGLSLDEGATVAGFLEDLSLDQRQGRMFLGEEDVSEEIRSPEVTADVSRVSAHPEVRRVLVSHQRAWVEQHGGEAVVEGRDIGSVVFPDATVKIYLDARPEVRAMRRAREAGTDLDDALDDLARRDTYDSTRAASPLAIPEGSVVVDTSDLTFEEVVDKVMSLVLAAVD